MDACTVVPLFRGADCPNCKDIINGIAFSMPSCLCHMDDTAIFLVFICFLVFLLARDIHLIYHIRCSRCLRLLISLQGSAGTSAVHCYYYYYRWPETKVEISIRYIRFVSNYKDSAQLV